MTVSASSVPTSTPIAVVLPDARTTTNEAKQIVMMEKTIEKRLIVAPFRKVLMMVMLLSDDRRDPDTTAIRFAYTPSFVCAGAHVVGPQLGTHFSMAPSAVSPDSHWRASMMEP